MTARVGIRLVEYPELWWCALDNCSDGWANPSRTPPQSFPYAQTWPADTPLRWCRALPLVVVDLHGREAALCMAHRDRILAANILKWTNVLWADGARMPNPAWATRDGIVVARVAPVEA